MATLEISSEQWLQYDRLLKNHDQSVADRYLDNLRQYALNPDRWREAQIKELMFEVQSNKEFVIESYFSPGRNIKGVKEDFVRDILLVCKQLEIATTRDLRRSLTLMGYSNVCVFAQPGMSMGNAIVELEESGALYKRNGLSQRFWQVAQPFNTGDFVVWLIGRKSERYGQIIDWERHKSTQVNLAKVKWENGTSSVVDPDQLLHAHSIVARQLAVTMSDFSSNAKKWDWQSWETQSRVNMESEGWTA